jgi:hypothetical protein
VSSRANTYALTTGSPAQIKATKQIFFNANVLIENLGAPAPQNVPMRSWLLSSHALTKSGQEVVAPTFPWILTSGGFDPLSATEAKVLVAAQAQVVDQIFAGQARTQTVAELRQTVDEEVGLAPQISAPGGASVVKWLRVNVAKGVAHLEADIKVWVSTPTLRKTGPGRYELVPIVNDSQVDALATLSLNGSRWTVTSFNQAPWQQAT